MENSFLVQCYVLHKQNFLVSEKQELLFIFIFSFFFFFRLYAMKRMSPRSLNQFFAIKKVRIL